MPGVFRWTGGVGGGGVSVFRDGILTKQFHLPLYQVAGISAMQVEFNTATILFSSDFE